MYMCNGQQSTYIWPYCVCWISKYVILIIVGGCITIFLQIKQIILGERKQDSKLLENLLIWENT